jgi:hypothetical protein
MFTGPNTTTNGLVLSLDAANAKSYISGSTTWRDLSGNNNSGSLVNGPTFSSANGGSIVFDGTNDYMITTSITNFRTISLWIDYKNIGLSWRYLLDARPGMGSGWYSPLGIGSNWQSQYINGQSTVVSFSSITIGIWCNLVLIADNNYTSTINFMSRVSNDENAQGSISNIQIYNRALSAQEVLQNYEGQKSRFGL